MHLPHKIEIGSRETSRGIENIAPATQKESRVTIVATDLHLPHKKEVGSQATLGSRSRKKCSEASKNIAPATQSERIGSRRTARRQGRNLPQNGTSVTGNFSQCHGDLLGGV